jgi:hypothetical protein
MLTVIFVLVSFLGFAKKNTTPTTTMNLPRYETTSEGGVTVGVRHLDEEILGDMFGSKSNPFIFLGSRPLTILEISIKSDSMLKLKYDTINLAVEKDIKAPINVFKLSNYWDRKLNTNSSYTHTPYKGWSYGKVSLRLRRNMLPSKLTLEPGSTYEGYLVYSGKTVYKNDATLFVPVLKENGTLLRELILEFELN